MHFVHVAVARVGVSLGDPVHPLEVASVGRTDRSGRTEGFTLVSLSELIKLEPGFMHSQWVWVFF